MPFVVLAKDVSEGHKTHPHDVGLSTSHRHEAGLRRDGVRGHKLRWSAKGASLCTRPLRVILSHRER
jgi:hypothetical protein